MEFLFIITFFTLAIMVYAVKIGGKEWLTNLFTTRKGLGVLKGIALAFTAVAAISIGLGFLTGCASTNPYLEVTAGVERTWKISPQCKPSSGIDTYLTSNLSFSGCFYAADDTIVCGVYRHHSCVLSDDRNSYDAIGINATKRVHLCSLLSAC